MVRPAALEAWESLPPRHLPSRTRWCRPLPISRRLDEGAITEWRADFGTHTSATRRLPGYPPSTLHFVGDTYLDVDLDISRLGPRLRGEAPGAEANAKRRSCMISEHRRIQ